MVATRRIPDRLRTFLGELLIGLELPPVHFGEMLSIVEEAFQVAGNTVLQNFDVRERNLLHGSLT